MKVGYIGVGKYGRPHVPQSIKRSNHSVTVFDLNLAAVKTCTDLGAAWPSPSPRRPGAPTSDDVAAHAARRRGRHPGRRRHPGECKQGPDLHRPQHQRALDGEEDRRRHAGQCHARRAGERRHGRRRGPRPSPSWSVATGRCSTTRCRCEMFSANVIHMGELGTGTVAKLVNNMMAFATPRRRPKG